MSARGEGRALPHDGGALPMTDDAATLPSQRALDLDCGCGSDPDGGGQRTLDLDCGIAIARLAGWLDDELALLHEGERYVFHQGKCACNVTLARLENRTVGLLDLERTRLVAQGDAEAVDVFERLFTLRFMSAGG